MPRRGFNQSEANHIHAEMFLIVLIERNLTSLSLLEDSRLVPTPQTLTWSHKIVTIKVHVAKIQLKHRYITPHIKNNSV